jgi:hypothetical protein
MDNLQQTRDMACDGVLGSGYEKRCDISRVDVRGEHMTTVFHDMLMAERFWPYDLPEVAERWPV